MLRNLSHGFCVMKNRKKDTSGEIFFSGKNDAFVDYKIK